MDTTIAQIYRSNGEAQVKGIRNGQTTLIISDNGGYYKKFPVSVYTTDVLELDMTDAELEAGLGRTAQCNASVITGNGGYTGTTDNTDVTVQVSDDGAIVIKAKTKHDTYTAKVTITDVTGLSASINLSVKSNMVPFTDAELEAIMSTNTRRYYIDGTPFEFITSGTTINKEDVNGVVQMGQDFYGYNVMVTFTGGKSVGKKTDATFTYNFYSGTTYNNEPVELEVIKNDGTNLWGIFSFLKDDYLHAGYFCDKVNP
jgi:hypothetical protein